MEKCRCGICSRCFSNGKALGGHMRTHLAFLPIPPKLKDSIKLDPSSSLHSAQEQEGLSLNHGSSKNPDKYFQPPDRISFRVDYNQTNSNKESAIRSRQKLTRRRSRRNCKLIHALVDLLDEPKSTSLVSITSPVEDVALSILMLSKGKGTYRKVEEEKGKEKVEENKEEANEDENGDDKEDDNDDDDDHDDNGIDNNNNGDNALYLTQAQARAQAGRTNRCETHKEAFRSHQVLECHRAKHKEIKVQIQETNEVDIGGGIGNIGKRIYKCPSCYRVFKSGQALGGHKKIHTSSLSNAVNPDKFGGNLIDLNLPPPEEVGENMWVELSASSNVKIFSSAGSSV